MSHNRRARAAAIAIAFLLLAGWLLPGLLSAERCRHRLEMALERSLRRRVTFRTLAFRLFPRPGIEMDNAVVREDPRFGAEPFARVDSIGCDLRWRSLWHSRIECSEIRLEGATVNLVRNERGDWNLEDQSLKSGLAASSGTVAGLGRAPASTLELEFSQARLNFKNGANKKAFALTAVRGHVSADPVHPSMEFRLEGKPVRAGFSLPSPGVVELTGRWSPDDAENPLRAEVRTRRGLLYDWIPLVTGRNPEIYGVLDAELRLAGSMRRLSLEGEGLLSQIHRWEEIPPSDSFSCKLSFQAQLDRRRGQVLVDRLDASLGNSRIHLSGSLDDLRASPNLDLLVAVERSRTEDFSALGRRLWGHSIPFGISGRVDGQLSIQGSWQGLGRGLGQGPGHEGRYRGFVSVRDARLTTPRGNFPVSDLELRIGNGEVRLAPVTLALAPRVDVVAEGALKPGADGWHYELGLVTNAVSLRDAVRFARAASVPFVQSLDAQGLGTAAFRIGGSAWPLTRPVVAGRAEVHDVRLRIAGMTEPVRIPRLRIQFNGDHILADPLMVSIGENTFTGHVEHRGERPEPWQFAISTKAVSLEAGALWFDAIAAEQPPTLLERLSRLGPLAASRDAASTLFGSLNGRGSFASSSLTYRNLTLRDFHTRVEIGGRVIRFKNAAFQTGGGRGRGEAEVNLKDAPAKIAGHVELDRASLRSSAPFLPDSLHGLRGMLSGTADFATRGLVHQEMVANLNGHAQVRLEKVSFGDFDPLEALVRKARAGALEPARGETSFHSAPLNLRLRDGRVFLDDCPVDLAGAHLVLKGNYGVDRGLDLDLRADLSRLKRRWIVGDPSAASTLQPAAQPSLQPLNLRLHLSGPLDKLAVVPEAPAFARQLAK